jgi:hypothetical protein
MSVVRDVPPVDAPMIDSPEIELPVRKDYRDPPSQSRIDPPVRNDYRDPPSQSRIEPLGRKDYSDPPSQSRIDPPTMMSPATGGLVGPGGIVGGDEEPPRVEAVRADPFAQPEPEVMAEDEDQPPSALREETPTGSAPSPSPSPSPRRRGEDPPSRPQLAPATGGVDKHSQAFVDDILNTQERNLLKELQDELARREQQEPPPSGDSGSWRVDRSGRHGKPHAGPFEHPNQTTGPMIINGVPPHDRGYPPAN